MKSRRVDAASFRLPVGCRPASRAVAAAILSSALAGASAAGAPAVPILAGDGAVVSPSTPSKTIEFSSTRLRLLQPSLGLHDVEDSVGRITTGGMEREPRLRLAVAGHDEPRSETAPADLAAEESAQPPLPSAAVIPGLPVEIVGTALVHLGFESRAAATRDLTRRGNDGEFDGGQWTAHGFIGGGLELDGDDDRVILRPAEDFNGLQDISVSVWARPRSMEQSGYIVSRWASQFILYANKGKPDNWRFLARGQDGVASGVPVGTVSLELGIWCHLVGTYDRRGKLSLYVNGEPVAIEDREPLPLADSRWEILIGAGLSGNSFHGTLDEVTIFRNALTADEVRHLHQHQRRLSRRFDTSLPKKNHEVEGTRPRKVK